jgi:hypothetical protein
MKKVFCNNWFLFVTIILLVIAAGCTKSPAPDVINYYSGSGGKGDVMSFSFNETFGGYTVQNESLGKYDNGSYTVYSNELKGLYKVFAYGSFYYAVELQGQAVTGNFPTASMGNNLSYGISKHSNALNTNVPGDYIYIHISNAQVNGSSLNKEWGILSISAGGSWKKQSYCNDTGSITRLMPDEYTGPLPLVNATDSGTWAINYINTERLIMAKKNSSDSLTGFPFASDSGAVFIMDLGYNKGLLVGCKVLQGDKNKLRGNYGYADVRYDGSTGGGKYSASDTSHNINWWRADSYAKVRNGVFGLMNQCNVLKNVFYCKNVVIYGDTVDFYTAVSGPYLLEFQFMQNKFRSYGTGIRLP